MVEIGLKKVGPVVDWELGGGGESFAPFYFWCPKFGSLCHLLPQLHATGPKENEKKKNYHGSATTRPLEIYL